ncbi:MAG: hypothetical protein COY81_00535 [Candidatus Pacebacteria bacterium CG_4_10_14_0_8_um_filter_43_12]|nr:MAG: hypothetical protein COY81_00535 [Candidatus Pacebacteria bacterium CG_4_10_14_0_8_um_filter_43_12]
MTFRFLKFVLVAFLVRLVRLGLSLSIVYAQTDSSFETTLETTYVVSDSGTTQVTHSFSVKNLQPTTYLKEYTLSTNFPQLQNVTASSNNQDITATVAHSQAKSVVGISFPDQVVGQGKVRQFKVQYEIPNMVTVAGQVLEAQIPPLTSPNPYKSHTVILKTPLRFGRAVRVKPEPASINLENQQLVTTFNETNPQTISAFFGDTQIYSMTLRYNLENNTSSPNLAQIALPPDTSFQRVSYYSLDPPTTDIKRDEDGNWLATYQLAPNTAQTVHLQADIQVTLDPNSLVPMIEPTSSLTAEKKYWETSNSAIQKVIQNKQSVGDLYQFVLQTLSYSYDKVKQNVITNRLGAVGALANPNQAVCQEFTDLFITLTRAKGIPARRLTGYAYTQNSALRPLSLEADVLHAWPEYFDSENKLWRPVDPTWESTTGGVDYFTQFDLNHVVFAINGKSSTTPYPAGSYKGTDLNTKDVEVTFATSFPKLKPDLSITTKPVKTFGLSIPGKNSLMIINTTGQAWYDLTLTFKSADSNLTLGQTQVFLPVILPFQLIELPFDTMSTNWQASQVAVSYNFSVKDSQDSHEGSISVQSGPPIVKYLTEQNLSIGLVIGGAVGIFGTGSLLVFRPRRKRSLRR